MSKRIVRSAFDLKGYHDEECDFPPSVVDSSQYESLADMVKKFLRGERKPRFEPVYTAAGEDPEKDISSMDVTRTDGFDLVDAEECRRRGEQALSAVEEHLRKKNVVKSEPATVAPAGAAAGTAARATGGAPVAGAPEGL